MVWLKLATGFSIFPLRIAMFLGGAMSLFSFALGFYFVIKALVLEREPAGWSSVIVAILFIGGIQLIGIGAVGEYIGRMFITQNQRPQFIVKQVYRSLPAPNVPASASGVTLRSERGAGTLESEHGNHG
jgi:undecaprenyl-phosphate 4-deoxy-4-formamido-L-arabinose transferase